MHTHGARRRRKRKSQHNDLYEHLNAQRAIELVKFSLAASQIRNGIESRAKTIEIYSSSQLTRREDFSSSKLTPGVDWVKDLSAWNAFSRCLKKRHADQAAKLQIPNASSAHKHTFRSRHFSRLSFLILSTFFFGRKYQIIKHNWSRAPSSFVQCDDGMLEWGMFVTVSVNRRPGIEILSWNGSANLMENQMSIVISSWKQTKIEEIDWTESLR